MSDHATYRSQLGLLAASALAPTERAALEAHIATCDECRAEFATYQLYARSLQSVPQPEVPLGLVARTQARLREQQAVREERRFRDRMLIFLVIYSWPLTLVPWLALRPLFDIPLVVFAAGSLFLTSTTAGAAAILIAKSKSVRTL